MSTRVQCSGCGREWPAGTDKCYKCGMSLSGLEDAEPTADEIIGRSQRKSKAKGVFRDGDKLVMVEGCTMPRRCPICNSEEVDYTTDLTIERETKEMGGISGMIKAGIDKVSGWNYTGPVDVQVYFCDRHSGRFRRKLIGGAIVAGVSILYLVYRYQTSGPHDPNASIPLDVIGGVVGAVGGIVAIAIFAKSPALAWFKPRRFVDRTVWVDGACRQFLETLPEKK